jgi:clan AA aspartic protease
MGETYTEITLKNATDVGMAKRRIIKKAEVRTVTVQAMADTGSNTLVITERIRKQLGLKILVSDEVVLANNQTAKCSMTEPVAIYWKNRVTHCDAMVISGEGEVLLGAIPMEGLNVIVDPTLQEVIGKYGDRVVFKAM